MHGILVSVALLTLAASPEDGSSDWMTSYGKALETARFAQQPLLVVLDNPNDPNQRFAPAEQPDETQKQLLKPYLLCRVDVSTPYGKQVAASFKTATFPHVAVIDKTAGYILYRKTGQVTSAEWAGTLVRYRTGTRISYSSATQQQPVVCRT